MSEPQWTCMKSDCPGPVRADPTTQFDTRYTTGYCKTHGKVALVRLVTAIERRHLSGSRVDTTQPSPPHQENT